MTKLNTEQYTNHTTPVGEVVFTNLHYKDELESYDVRIRIKADIAEEWFAPFEKDIKANAKKQKAKAPTKLSKAAYVKSGDVDDDGYLEFSCFQKDISKVNVMEFKDGAVVPANNRYLQSVREYGPRADDYPPLPEEELVQGDKVKLGFTCRLASKPGNGIAGAAMYLKEIVVMERAPKVDSGSGSGSYGFDYGDFKTTGRIETDPDEISEEEVAAAQEEVSEESKMKSAAQF